MASEEESCSSCSIGILYGHGRGGHCPLIDCEYRAGEWLREPGGGPHRFAWYIKEGEVALVQGEDEASRLGPGEVIGVERDDPCGLKAVGRVVACRAPVERMRELESQRRTRGGFVTTSGGKES